MGGHSSPFPPYQACHSSWYLPTCRIFWFLLPRAAHCARLMALPSHPLPVYVPYIIILLDSCAMWYADVAGAFARLRFARGTFAARGNSTSRILFTANICLMCRGWLYYCSGVAVLPSRVWFFHSDNVRAFAFFRTRYSSLTTLLFHLLCCADVWTHWTGTGHLLTIRLFFRRAAFTQRLRIGVFNKTFRCVSTDKSFNERCLFFFLPYPCVSLTCLLPVERLRHSPPPFSFFLNTCLYACFLCLCLCASATHLRWMEAVWHGMHSACDTLYTHLCCVCCSVYLLPYSFSASTCSAYPSTPLTFVHVFAFYHHLHACYPCLPPCCPSKHVWHLRLLPVFHFYTHIVSILTSIGGCSLYLHCVQAFVPACSGLVAFSCRTGTGGGCLCGLPIILVVVWWAVLLPAILITTILFVFVFGDVCILCAFFCMCVVNFLENFVAFSTILSLFCVILYLPALPNFVWHVGDLLLFPNIPLCSSVWHLVLYVWHAFLCLLHFHCDILFYSLNIFILFHSYACSSFYMPSLLYLLFSPIPFLHFPNILCDACICACGWYMEPTVFHWFVVAPFPLLNRMTYLLYLPSLGRFDFHWWCFGRLCITSYGGDSSPPFSSLGLLCMCFAFHSFWHVFCIFGIFLVWCGHF